MTDDIINQNGRPYETLASPRTWEMYGNALSLVRAITGYKGTIIALNPIDAELFGPPKPGTEEIVSGLKMLEEAIPKQHPYYGTFREQYEKMGRTEEGELITILQRSPRALVLPPPLLHDDVALIGVGPLVENIEVFGSSLSGLNLNEYPLHLEGTRDEWYALVFAHEWVHTQKQHMTANIGEMVRDRGGNIFSDFKGVLLEQEIQADCGAFDLVRAFNESGAGQINPRAIQSFADTRALGAIHNRSDIDHATSVAFTGDGTTCESDPSGSVEQAETSLRELHDRIDEKIGRFYADRVLEKLAVMGTGKGPTTFTGPLTFIESLGEAYGYETLIASVGDLDPAMMRVVGHKVRAEPFTKASALVDGAVRQIACEGNLNPYQRKYVDNYVLAVGRTVPSLAEDPEAQKIAKFESDRAVLHALAQDTLDARTIALAEKENEWLKAEEDVFWGKFADGENKGTYGTEKNNEEQPAGVEPDNTPAPLSRAQSTAAPAPA